MSRKNALLFGVVAMLLAAPAAHAAGWMIGLNGGISVPTGDFGDENGFDGKAGPIAGLDICYMVNDQFAVGVDGSWMQNKHGAEGSVEDLGGGMTLTANKDKFLTLQGGVHGKFMFPMQDGPVAPYALLGVGVFNLKEDYDYTLDDNGTITTFTDESDNAETETRLGGKVGIGAIFKASEQIGVTVRGAYNFITMDKDKTGVSSLQFVDVRAGVVLHIMPK